MSDGRHEHLARPVHVCDLGLRASSGMYKSLCLAFFFCWRITDKSRVLKIKYQTYIRTLFEVRNEQ